MALLMNVGTGLGKLCAGDSVWTHLGLDGGFISTLTIDPQNAGNLYVKTALGLFKTTDGGATWNVLNSSLMTKVSPGSLVIDPRNPNTLYAGVLGNLGLPYQPSGIFKSNDGGTTWSAVGEASFGSGYFSGDLAIDPQDPNTLYAMDLTPHNQPYASWNYIFKSTDGGTRWTPIASLPPYGIGTLAIDPQNSSTLYAGGGTSGTIYKSTDGGTIWSASPLPPESLTPDDDDGWTPVISLAVDPRNSNTVYAAGSGGIFKSTDGVVSWNTMNSGLSLYACSGGPPCFEPFYVGSLLIDPQNSSTLYATAGHASFPIPGGVLRSTDGGATWSQMNEGLPRLSSWRRRLAIDPNTHTLYLAANDDGVYALTFIPQ